MMPTQHIPVASALAGGGNGVHNKIHLHCKAALGTSGHCAGAAIRVAVVTTGPALIAALVGAKSEGRCPVCCVIWTSFTTTRAQETFPTPSIPRCLYNAPCI